MKERKKDQTKYNISLFLKTTKRKNGNFFIEPLLKDSLTKKYADITPFIYEFLDSNEEFFGIWLKKIPFCVLTPNAYDHIIPAGKNKIGEKSKLCNMCRFNKECFGFPVGYLKKYGDKELKPILDIPEEIMIEIEPNCNFKCQFCFNKISFAKKDRNIEKLSFGYIKKILDHISKKGIKRVRFTGGEPLLYPQIIEVMEYAKKKGLYVILNTNGSLINKKIANKLSGIVDDALIPIESYLESEEEKIAGYKNVLQKKIRAIKLLKNYNIPIIRVGTVATKKTIKNFEKIFNFISGLPVSDWGIFRPVLADSSFSNIDITKLVSKIYKVKKNSHITISLANAIPFCSIKDVNKINNISSGALYDDGHRRMVIDARGFVKPHYFIDKNIGEPLDLLGAWNHPFVKKMRRLKFVPKECQKCLFVKKCCGGSRYLAMLNKGNYNSDDPLSDYSNKKYIK